MKCDRKTERQYFGEPEEICGGKLLAHSSIEASGGKIEIKIEMVCEKCSNKSYHWHSLLDEMLTDYIEKMDD